VEGGAGVWVERRAAVALYAGMPSKRAAHAQCARGRESRAAFQTGLRMHARTWA